MRADVTKRSRTGTQRRRARVTALPLIVLIRAYQLLLSPWVGNACRFQPSCSQYGIEALETHGALRGSWLTLRRVLRCRPGGGSGYDPVPEPDDYRD